MVRTPTVSKALTNERIMALNNYIKMQSLLALKRLRPLCKLQTFRAFSKTNVNNGFKLENNIKFDHEGRYLVYQAEGSESFLKFLTRANVFFIIGNSGLLIIEVVSPCKSRFALNFLVFGYWHGLSMLTVVLMSLTGARMLQSYSCRMVNNMWLLRDGKNV